MSSKCMWFVFEQFSKGFPHVWISQYGKTGKSLLWCSINLSRALPLGLRPSYPFLTWLKMSCIETFGYRQGKLSYYTGSVETIKSQQDDGFSLIPCFWVPTRWEIFLLHKFSWGIKVPARWCLFLNLMFELVRMVSLEWFCCYVQRISQGLHPCLN